MDSCFRRNDGRVALLSQVQKEPELLGQMWTSAAYKQEGYDNIGELASRTRKMKYSKCGHEEDKVIGSKSGY